jgi:pimeloyl-ACP methyl ester carboxylesterase
MKSLVSASNTLGFLGPLAFGLCAATVDAADPPPAPVAGEAPRIVVKNFLIPSADPGIDLYVRNKHLAGERVYTPDKILLFVHGATYPAESAFDLALDGMSWMDYIARRGYDVYLVDVRGYGRSTRLPEMDRPPGENPPIVRTPVAVKDVGTAVDFILERRGVDKLNLLGWSWGTTLMGWYTAQNNAKVNKLVLYAPQWLRTTGSLTDNGAPLGAYRNVSMDTAKARWLTGVPEDKKAALIPPGWFEAWAAATLNSDPLAATWKPPVIRAPNGVVLDGREYWSAGKPMYDPADIRVPTFLAHAEWDADLPSYMLHAYYARLVNAPERGFIEIPEGTHTVIMEKNRMMLFEAVQKFLDKQ